MTKRARFCVSLALASIVALTALPASSTPLTSDATAGFHVVTFNARITDPMRAALVSTGSTIIDYEPQNGYLVWATPVEIERARRLASISSVTPMSPQRKTHSSLGGGGWGSLQVIVYGPKSGEVAAALSVMGDIVNGYPVRADDLLVGLEVRGVQESAIEAIASLAGVFYVSPAPLGLTPEDEATDQIQAGNIARKANTPVPEYLAWLKRVRLSGKGVRAAIVDTGIDEDHPAFQDRVVEEIDYSIAAEPIDSYGHGTHVAGIVGAMPSDDTNYTDSNGFAYGLGVAPEVKLINQNAIGTTGYGSAQPVSEPWPPSAGLQVLSKDSWNAGAHMWNASWHTGEGTRAGYIATVRTIDEMSRNADFDKKGSEEFLMVFSAGNSGASGPTVPHEAKNIIAVGATMSGRGGNAGLGSPTDIDAMASFSARGPALDGRIFPTVAAPGANVVSTRAHAGQVCNVPPPDSFGSYAFCSGTSMAAPHVTGAAALVHQWWKRDHGGWPSPAMVRSLLVNSATDMTSPDIPNILEGWGRVNLGSLFSRTPGEFHDQRTTFRSRGQDKTFTVRVRDAKIPLKVTLGWSDAPGAVGAKVALVNDLDLTVQLVKGGKVVRTWRGNVFENGQSVPGGKADRLNNLENVYLLKPAVGTYRISVKAHNMPGDGVPFNDDKTDQDFAFVVRGAI